MKLEKIWNKEYAGDLHAEIKILKKENDGYYVGNNKITVHFGENEDQWKTGVVRMEIEDKSAEISIDTIMSVMHTVYGADLFQRVDGTLSYIWLRIKSFIIKKWKK